MARKNKLTDEQRVRAVQEYLTGNGSYGQIARKYGIAYQSLTVMVQRAATEGIESIKSGRNRKYSAETRNNAVLDYISGKGSQAEICSKYRIKSTSILRGWISWYNSGKDFKEHSRSERGFTMKKGRKTTIEERAEIVAYCIANGKDYGLTAEKYGVSYQQVYSWVRKYEAKGTDGLIDRRGKAKPEEELTEADKLRMENKILQARIKDREMEIAILKKLRELRGGGR